MTFKEVPRECASPRCWLCGISCSGRIIGTCMLALCFFLILTPLAWALRLLGIDLLQLKHPQHGSSCWQQAKDSGPLKRPY
jgi:hypothetical protein